MSDIPERAGSARVEGPSPSVFTCPTCGGVLREADADPRYRCHNGHDFTDESLAKAQRHPIEAALWVALRALQEHAELCRRITEDARAAGRGQNAALFERKRAEAERRAGEIRRLLEGG